MVSLKTQALVFALLGTLATASWSSIGHAEPMEEPRSTPGDYEYRFIDDDLLGNSLANSGDIYKGRAGFHRVLLLRPRTAFVVQLFKSVENL